MHRNEPLEKLASTGLLRQEPPGHDEVVGLLRTASIRLADAQKIEATLEVERRVRAVAESYGFL